eukprot:187398_1
MEKLIDTKTKNLVYGYIRKNEKLLNGLNIIYSNMPELVMYICLTYYYIGHYFEKLPTCLKAHTELTNGQTTIWKIDLDKCLNNAVYGNEWINSNAKTKYIWTIKANRSRSYGGIGIGIVSNKHHQNIDFDWDDKFSYYCSNGGYLAINGIKTSENGAEYTTDDVFSFILDLNEKCIYYHVNGNKKQILFQHVETGEDIKYRFALSLFYLHDSVTVCWKKE